MEAISKEGNAQEDCRRGLALGWSLLNNERGAIESANMVIHERDASTRLSAARSLGLTHSSSVNQLIVRQLTDNSASFSPDKKAHLVTAVVLAQAAVLHGAADQCDEFLGIDWLADEIVDPVA